MGLGLGLGVNELLLTGICMEGEKHCCKDNEYIFTCISDKKIQMDTQQNGVIICLCNIHIMSWMFIYAVFTAVFATLKI